MAVKLGIEVLPVSIPERQSHSEIDDAFDPGFYAVIQYPLYILRRIIEKRQDRTQPHDGRNSGLPKQFQRFDPLSGSGNIGFDLAALLSPPTKWHIKDWP